MYRPSSPHYKSRGKQIDRQNRGKPASNEKSRVEEHSSERAHMHARAHACMHTHSWFLQPLPFPSRNFQKSSSWARSGLTLLISKGSKAGWRRVFPKDLLLNLLNDHLGLPLTPNPNGRKQESGRRIPLYMYTCAPAHPPYTHTYTHTCVYSWGDSLEFFPRRFLPPAKWDKRRIVIGFFNA